MNVAFDPWIPVVMSDGERGLVSLQDVFLNGKEISDLAVRPHERISLMRLFLCVAYAALNGPKDYDEWCFLPDRIERSVSHYLEKWKDSFELFHPTKPWLQIADLDLIQTNANENSNDEDGWSPIRKLCLTKASGNNSTLFDHSANRAELETYSDAVIALNLLTFQNFFVAGGKASERRWGQVELRNPANPKGGPCSGKSILFALIRGSNLEQTIIKNLNNFDDLKYVYSPDSDFIGKPVWEYPIKEPSDQAAIHNATHTHLGRLVPLTRMLRINKDRKRVLLGPGFIYPKFQDKDNPFVPDVFSTLKTNANNESVLLSVNPDKALWRELHSIIIYKTSDNPHARGPLSLRNITIDEGFDLIVDAMVTNPEQAAEIILLMESVFSISPQMRTDEGRSVYIEEVKLAESVFQKLGWAIEKYREQIDGGWKKRLEKAGPKKANLKKKLHFFVSNCYWTSIESNLFLLMTHVNALQTSDFDSTKEAWRKMLFSSARDAYRNACGQETPRQIRAFTEGWQVLTSTNITTENDPNTNEEEDE